MKIQNKKFGGVGSGGGGGQGGCELRIEVFEKIHKKMGGRGVRVGGSNVNKELKFLGKFKKKLGVVGSGGGRVSGWVRVDVNEKLKFL